MNIYEDEYIWMYDVHSETPFKHIVFSFLCIYLFYFGGGRVI